MKSYTIGYKLVGSTTEIKFFYQVLKSSFWVPFHWRSLVLFRFLLGDDATIWYSIVWHRTVWYGEEEFGFVLDDNGFGGWHNVGWWVAQWNRWQCAQGATCHRCHQLSVISPSTVANTFLFFPPLNPTNFCLKIRLLFVAS